MILYDPVRFAFFLVVASLVLLGLCHLAYLVTGRALGLAPFLSFALGSAGAAWLTRRQGARLSRLTAFIACGVGYAVVTPIAAWFGSVEFGGAYGVIVVMLAVLAVLVVPVSALGTVAVNAVSWRPRQFGENIGP